MIHLIQEKKGVAKKRLRASAIWVVSVSKLIFEEADNLLWWPGSLGRI